MQKWLLSNTNHGDIVIKTLMMCLKQLQLPGLPGRECFTTNTIFHRRLTVLAIGGGGFEPGMKTEATVI